MSAGAFEYVPAAQVSAVAEQEPLTVVAATVQDSCVYEPESEPAVQVRVCGVHVEGLVTDENRYAVTEPPLATEPPQGRAQEFALHCAVDPPPLTGIVEGIAGDQPVKV